MRSGFTLLTTTSRESRRGRTTPAPRISSPTIRRRPWGAAMPGTTRAATVAARKSTLGKLTDQRAHEPGHVPLGGQLTTTGKAVKAMSGAASASSSATWAKGCCSTTRSKMAVDLGVAGGCVPWWPLQVGHLGTRVSIESALSIEDAEPSSGRPARTRRSLAPTYTQDLTLTPPRRR